MSQPIQLESRIVSEELCVLLQQVDPIAWRDELEAEVRARTESIAARLRIFLATEAEDTSGPAGRVREGLHGVLAAVERATPTAARSRRAAWTAFQREVQPAYESLAASLRSMAVPAPSLRPTNLTRSFFHVCSALAALAMIQALPSRASLICASLAFTVAGWTMETMRRRSDVVNQRLMTLFSPVAHPHERHRVNSSTWYVTALLLLAIFFPREACALGVIVLGVADPLAALVGRRFGRTRLRAGRSLEGTLAFFVAGTLAALAMVRVLYPQSPAPMLLAIVAGAAGAIAELLSTKVDDNFSIPLGVAAAAAAALSILGG